MTPREAILSSDGQLFGVHFYKKDGTLRHMSARLAVRKGVKGVGMSWDPTEKGMMVVYDMNAQGFRMVTLNRVTKVVVNGHHYHFTPEL